MYRFLEFVENIFFSHFIALDPTTHNTITISDSKQNLKEASSPFTTNPSTLGGSLLGSTGNHLDIPTNNPNLLSPDVLSQRRGLFQLFHIV